jgi:RNA polymerase sigma factor (sigma-70 family)
MKNTPSHTDDIACRRAVQGLIEKYGWALLPEDDLVALVLGAAQTEPSPAGLKKQALRQYTMVLYEACRQTKDPHRRERAYHELFRYLFRAAYNRWPDLAEDVTQRALVLVCAQIDRCRHPVAFLAFALYKLQHAFQQERRARGRDWSEEEISQRSTEREQAEFQSYLGEKEWLQMLVGAIQRLPDKRQQKAILHKFLGGLSDEEISAHIGVTVNNVRVLRHRGIVQLREDERLRDYFKVGP